MRVHRGWHSPQILSKAARLFRNNNARRLVRLSRADMEQSHTENTPWRSYITYIPPFSIWLVLEMPWPLKSVTIFFPFFCILVPNFLEHFATMLSPCYINFKRIGFFLWCLRCESSQKYQKWETLPVEANHHSTRISSQESAYMSWRPLLTPFYCGT